MSNIVMSDEVVGLDAFRVIRTSGLAAAERAAVDGLIELVDAHEGLRLPLMAEPPGLPPGMQRELFLGYEGETLVGFASLEGEPDAELCGLVHPAYRRRGIGAALLAAARSTGRERGAPGCLVVCDEASPSGPAFAVAAGGQRRFAEYRMLLDVAQFRPPAAPDGLQFRQAGAADLEKLVRVTAAAFGDAEEKVRPLIGRWLEQPTERFYLLALPEEVIGSLRVSFLSAGVYINTFGILPHLQGRGYGRQLLSRTIAALLAEGRTNIYIEVMTANANALALYRACGFREFTTYGFYYLAH